MYGYLHIAYASSTSAFPNTNENAKPQETNAIQTHNSSEKNVNCDGKSFCTEVPNYLEQTQLHNISLENLAQFPAHFRDDYTGDTAVRSMHYTDSDEFDYCDSITRLVYPQSAETKDSKSVLVVQRGGNKQGILIEECTETNKECRFADSLPVGYTSTCTQRYTFRSVVVFMNGELKEELIKIPSSCKCSIKFRGN
ncbi:PREDICTED: protein spaetzle isoform X1 [Rhagoletis zephyria]|uniref:protein spaetzle isoform X1 n=1 Tax=Rhagoletis zephyria TaxID=28612 RepID=UPI0008116B99|nr:PREDICTED: protein spaetzle isoform X1 [Rhagoletis zephyria]